MIEKYKWGNYSTLKFGKSETTSNIEGKSPQK